MLSCQLANRASGTPLIPTATAVHCSGFEANHSLNSINCFQSHLILHWRHLADTHSQRLTASVAEQEALKSRFIGFTSEDREGQSGGSYRPNKYSWGHMRWCVCMMKRVERRLSGVCWCRNRTQQQSRDPQSQKCFCNIMVIKDWVFQTENVRELSWKDDESLKTLS